MDDSTTIKKKKFGGIRRLGKFFGLGGSATKSETKSQIDDYEEFDLGTATNGIESIMALTPEQRALPVILLTEPDTKPTSPVSVNSSSGFKPKSIPTSLNRAPGRVLSPRNRESEFIAKVPTQDLPSPVAAAPAVVAPAPAQRVEDIIRLKIPLHRRNSKSTSSGSEERTETIATASPVAVNVRSPISANDQKTLIQTFLSEKEDPDLSMEPLSPTTHEPQESKFRCEESSAPCVKVVQITLDLSSESLDPPTVPSEATLIKCRSVSTDDPLRCTSFDPDLNNVTTSPALDETTRMKSTSCDSEDSFTLKISQDLLSQPIVVKSKQDLRAEFLNFRRHNSRIQMSQSGESSAQGSEPQTSRTNESSLSQSGEEKLDENERGDDDDDESVSSYASDEIESVVSSDEEEANNSSDLGSATGGGSHPIFRTESIPEGDEENSDEEQMAADVKVALSQSISTDTSDVSLSDLQVTAIKPKRQSTNVGKSSSLLLDSTKPKRSKRLSMSAATSAPNATTGAGAGTGPTKSTKQRSKSILPNPNPSSTSGGGWNGSTKPLPTSKSSNPPPTTQPPSTKSTTKSRRHSTSHTPNTSSTTNTTTTAGTLKSQPTLTLRSSRSLEHSRSNSSTSLLTDSEAVLSSSSSRDPESPEIKVTKVSPTNATSRASVDSNRRKSMATSSERSRIPSSRNLISSTAGSGR